MGVDRSGSAARIRKAWLGTLLLALAIGCTPAPLAGKPCPCVDGSTYMCCETLQVCMTDLTRCPPPAPPAPTPCSSTMISSLIVTGNGLPPPTPGTSDAGAPQLTFGTAPEQWVSFTFQGTDENPPMVTASDDGNGIHVAATFQAGIGTADAYEGAGLSFAGDHCVDGSALTGVQFDFDGVLGGRILEVGVTSSEDVDVMYPHGICTDGPKKCYGPTKPLDPTKGTKKVFFTQLDHGLPSPTLDTSRIVNVQWQVHDAENPSAEFTITNVRLLNEQPPPDGGQPPDGG